jgi:8-oxo-dGTP pyrophosphatase MutT (NUDIX family)
VPFKHSETCPFEDSKYSTNEDALVRPCAVVLIQNKKSKNILATQRHEHMSFGGQWVLPGGHLEPK